MPSIRLARPAAEAGVRLGSVIATFSPGFGDCLYFGLMQLNYIVIHYNFKLRNQRESFKTIICASGNKKRLIVSRY